MKKTRGPLRNRAPLPKRLKKPPEAYFSAL